MPVSEETRMILSTVNLVNNYKFSDFIIKKITEEQTERDIEVVKKTKRHSFGAVTRRDSETACSRKRASMRERRSADAAEQAQNRTSTEIPTGDLVSIATADGHMVSADCSLCHVRLCQQPTVATNNVFRKVKIEEGSSEKQQLYVFQLYSNPSYYLATCSETGLQIQSYCADALDLNLPDERMFLCHEHSNGAAVVQPLLQPGLYLHHRDAQISLRKFELNLRPPEEFFIYINSVPAQTLAQIQLETSLKAEVAAAKVEVASENVPQSSLPVETTSRKEDSKSFWRRGSKKKDKTKASPITPQPGPLSCFGVNKKKKSRKFWR